MKQAVDEIQQLSLAKQFIDEAERHLPNSQH